MTWHPPQAYAQPHLAPNIFGMRNARGHDITIIAVRTDRAEAIFLHAQVREKDVPLCQEEIDHIRALFWDAEDLVERVPGIGQDANPSTEFLLCVRRPLTV